MTASFNKIPTGQRNEQDEKSWRPCERFYTKPIMTLHLGRVDTVLV